MLSYTLSFSLAIFIFVNFDEWIIQAYYLRYPDISLDISFQVTKIIRPISRTNPTK